MQRDCFTFRSITAAMQAQAMLKGIRAEVMRTPSELRTSGCGYCLRIGRESFAAAESILSKNGRRYQKIYRREESGHWQEVEV